MKYLRLSILTLILAIALASLTSYNVSAITYGSTGSTGYSSGELHYIDVYGSNAVAYGVANNTDGMSFGSPTTLGATWSIGLSFKTVPAGKFLASLPYRLCFSNPDDMKSWIGFSSNSYYYLVSNDWEYTSAGCISGVVSYFANGGYNNISLGNSGPILGSVASSYNFVFGKMSYTLVSDDADYTSVLNSIKNNTNDIKTKMDNLKSSMDDLADNEGRVADVAEDEYNKTIEDEQTASAGAGGFSFNFSLPNPFGIFQVSDGCVSTPTIDSWLHLDGDWKSPHCPIIPVNVRNILTPVVTLIVTLATLLVVIRWVSSSAVDVAGNSVAMNDKPQKGGK